MGSCFIENTLFILGWAGEEENSEKYQIYLG